MRGEQCKSSTVHVRGETCGGRPESISGEGAVSITRVSRNYERLYKTIGTIVDVK